MRQDGLSLEDFGYGESCNAYRYNGVPVTLSSLNNNYNDGNIGQEGDEPCNNDLDYTLYGEHGFDDDQYGVYNVYGNEEKGTGDKRKFTDELKEMIYKMIILIFLKHLN